jgi:pyrroline-5-carboxylate reductase
VIGLIGSGNMARALVRGWGEPVLCTDLLPDRAKALADEVGGEAVA